MSRHRYQRGSVRKPWSEQTWLARCRRAIRRHDRNSLAALLAEGDDARPEHGRRRLYQRQAIELLTGRRWWRLEPILCRVVVGAYPGGGVIYNVREQP